MDDEPDTHRRRLTAASLAGCLVGAALLAVLVLLGRPVHSTRIDVATLQAAVASAHEQDQAAAQARPRAPTDDARRGGPRADRSAALAEHRAERLQAQVEQVSRADLALEQVRTLARPPATHSDPPLVWPVRGAVVAGYGLRAWPDFARMHLGIDIVNIPGTPVGAAADGIVVAVRRDRTYGNAVVLDHGEQEQHPGRWTTVYGHLDEISVAEGEQVRTGAQIGTLGNSGRMTTGPHLHFEVRIEDRPVDPRRWLP